ncbi:MAG: tetratricopeptide repeat protein [Gemmatimonadetes bacterium]|nr:tetratricopeptide repeat protein [Gemmatimonadota bacterium]
METEEETAERVKAHLEAGEPCLLILDNVEGASQWKDRNWVQVLPTGNCRRLITTRAGWLPGVKMYPLSRLTTEDGLRLLGKYRPDVDQHRETVEDVVEWFDGLAVGLTVVGVYMELHPDLSWERYVQSLQMKGLGTVRRTEDEVGGLPQYEERVDAVFDDLLESLPVAERRVVEYAALLPEDNVYRLWLADLLSVDREIELPEAPGYEDQAEDAVIQRLIDRQLLRGRGEEEFVLGLHRVLRRRVRERLEEEERSGGLIDRVVEMAERRGMRSHVAVTETTLRTELTPLLLLSEELEELGRVEVAVSLANWISKPLQELGRYREGRTLLEHLATLHGDSLPRPAVATLYSNLALILKDLGELAEARRRMERVIEIDGEHFSPNHPTLATNYSNLATILRDLGELADARRRMERAIEIGEQHFSPNHPTLATSYSNLALILRDLGELAEARRRMERAIEIEEEHFSPNHPTLATSYSNLALVLQDLGELAEARRRMERAIEIDEQHFSPNHPTLATSYNNLGHIELADGRSEQACVLFRRAKVILEKHFTPNHPHIQIVSRTIDAVCGKPRKGTHEE